MAFVGIYRALYDYHPQSSEELSLQTSDLLFILDKSSDDGWWRCRKKAASDEDDEPEGLIPNNYVEEVQPTHKARALYDYTKQTDEELSFQEGEELSVFDEGDEDWTLVGNKGEYGFVPAIYIESLPAGGGGSGSGQVRGAPPAMPPRPAVAADKDEPIPGEEDYVPPSSPAANNPAAQLAGILAQKTGTEPPAPRTLASPPPPSARVQYTPDPSSAEEEEEEAPPPKPARPASQSLPSSPQVQSPKRSESQYTPSGAFDAGPILPTPDSPRSPGGYHLYNIHETLSHMGKSRKLPTTLGINVMKGVIMISPDDKKSKKSDSGAQQEWTAEKLQHYSIEGKHVFLELVRPSRSVDFHAGAKDTAQEIVAHLGELAGAARMEGLREVWDAASGGSGGRKMGKMLYDFLAQGSDEVSVEADDEVIVLDDAKSEEWWMVRRLKNGKEGVVPSSYVEVTGTTTGGGSMSGVNAGRSTVEQNRLEEERLAKEAAKHFGRDFNATKGIPERQSSLSTSSSPPPAASSRRHGRQRSTGGPSNSKSKPNTSRVRTWTDRSGTFKVDAEFIGLREGKIHLHKLNGVKIAVPVAKMAVEDLEYVERATGASLDEDKPLSEIKRKSTQRAAGRAGGSGGGGAGASVQKDQDYWFEFFLSCGVNPQICDRYASAFSKDQMGPEVLPEVNEGLLRTLGLKEGDILRVMKVLDRKFDRAGGGTKGAGEGAGTGEGGGLFSGPGGALKDNTRKGRPAPAVQTNDVVSADAFRTEDDGGDEGSGRVKSSAEEGKRATPLTTAPTREPKTGFEDDAWDVKPVRRTATPSEPPRQPEAPPKPLINEDIETLSLTSPPLQPTPAPPPPTATTQPPLSSAGEQQKQGADQAIFDKIASLTPSRQRPLPPPQQPGAVVLAPPPRASSAPGFPQQSGFGSVQPLQAQLTGYQPQQQTGFQGYPQGQQLNGGGFMAQPTGIQAVQQNYPALQPQPTGLSFQPQSQFGQVQQAQQYGPSQGFQGGQQTGFQGQQQGVGFQPQQTGFQPQQQFMNGGTQPSNSPFADPPRQPYQPGVSSGLHNSFSAQQTGFQPQQQQQFPSIAQPTGMNGYGPSPPQMGPPPQLPPQQTGGVFGPPQPTGLKPLVPQQTGPAPPVRFGVKPAERGLLPQPTGRANLSKATPQNPFGF